MAPATSNRLRTRSLWAVAAVLGAAIVPATASVGGEAEEARKILGESGIQGGLIVHVGCGDGRMTATLRASDSFMVHGLDRSAENVEAARKHIQSRGLYGSVSVAQWDGKRLPYIENFANLIVARGECRVTNDELMRVLAPHGVALVEGKKTVKPRPPEVDEWTHYLHDPSNNAVAHDTAIGFLTRMQWITGPRYSRHHDHMSGASAMAGACGRPSIRRSAMLAVPRTSWCSTVRRIQSYSLLLKVSRISSRHAPYSSRLSEL